MKIDDYTKVKMQVIIKEVLKTRNLSTLPELPNTFFTHVGTLRWTIEDRHLSGYTHILYNDLLIAVDIGAADPPVLIKGPGAELIIDYVVKEIRSRKGQ